MHLRARRAAGLAALWLSCSPVVGAIPSVNFPLNSQVPPVARASQQFSFMFAESAFLSQNQPITYTLQNGPSWLQLDSDTRTLFGEVPRDATGPATFRLIASDAVGSASSETTLVVSDQAGPQLGSPLLPQLSRAGPVSAPASLLLRALEDFSFAFDPNIFSGTSAVTQFYATSIDNSPLPSWLQFYSTSLRFSGKAPPLINVVTRPQEYGVRLVASDISGFAQAIATFQLVVVSRILAFSESFQTTQISPGQPFKTKSFREALELDGEMINNAEIASVASNGPSWVKLDRESISLSGEPPEDATSQIVLIQAIDTSGATANLSISLDITSIQTRLFKYDLPSVNATVGQKFIYTIDPDALSSKDAQLTVDAHSASSWLTYDATSRTLSGSVPSDLPTGRMMITIVATLGAATEEKELYVNLQKKTVSQSSIRSTRSMPTSTGSVEPEVTPISNEAPNGGSKAKNRSLVIALGVLVPLLGLVCLGFFIRCCYWSKRRRHRLKEETAQKLDQDVEKTSSSPTGDTGTDDQGTTPLGRVETDAENGDPTPADPPRIDLPWAPGATSNSGKRSSKSTVIRENTLSSADWGDLVLQDENLPVGRDPRQLQRKRPGEDPGGRSGDWIPFARENSGSLNYSKKTTPFRPTQSRIVKSPRASRASQTPSGFSTMSVGLPTRLSGAGHGAGGPGPPGFRGVRQSWRETFDFSAHEGGRSTPIDLSAFPEPPRIQTEGPDTQGQRRAKASIRLVSNSSSFNESLEDQRQRWVRDRAKDRYSGRGSRFSHTWSPKGYSSHRRARRFDSDMRSSSIFTSGPLDPGDLASHQYPHNTWSRSSSLGALGKVDSSTRLKSPESYLVRHPSKLRRALSTVSSGNFDSLGPKSESSWGDDLIEEEEDENGHRRWVTIDSPLQENTGPLKPRLLEGERSDQVHWVDSPRMGGLGALKANIQSSAGVGAAATGSEDGIESTAMAATGGERKWRLGRGQAKRPVSVDEGEFQRSQGSHRGDLAFV